MNEKDIVSTSKFLSLVLRHKPEVLGITMDEHGYVSVAELLTKCANHKYCINFTELKHIVDTNNKKRFKFNDDFTKIRASQGHSISVKLGYKPAQPPDYLYHGTGVKSVDSILKSGLEKRGRQYVHLSVDRGTAENVGRRHGDLSIFLVNTGDMYKKEFKFFLSDNNVWLTDHVPAEYLLIV